MWYEDASLMTAYAKHFEECVSEGGFDQKEFMDMMGVALMESEFAYSKDAFNEACEQILDAALDHYGTLCEP